jgi:hypothetical protein
MSASDRYQAELEYLSDYVSDVLRELNWMISIEGACDDYEARANGVGCRRCAFDALKH